MKAERAFISHLKDNTEVRVVVGDRIYRQNAPPRAALPYIVVQRTPGTRREHHQSGVANVHGVQLLVDSYAATLDGAESLGDSVRLAIDGMVNASIGSPPNDVGIASATLTDDFPDAVESSAGAGVSVYRWNQNWFVWADETAAVFA